MTARMHPLFVELFLDPSRDEQDDDGARRAKQVRHARARRALRAQTVRARPTARQG